MSDLFHSRKNSRPDSLSFFLPALLLLILFSCSRHARAAEEVPVWRVYNPFTGEHLFTADAVEKTHLVEVDAWIEEGTGWYETSEGTPVWRLFNPCTGEHFYTADANEYNVLGESGWNREGVAWYAPAGKIPVWRVFNEAAAIGAHHFTVDENEYTTLIKKGWQDEQIAWTAVRSGEPAAAYAAPWAVADASNHETEGFVITAGSLDVPGGTAAVRFAVWRQADQSDLRWYEAGQTAEGTWQARVPWRDFCGLSGTYSIHVYAENAAGRTFPRTSTVITDPFAGVQGTPEAEAYRKAAVWVETVTEPQMTREEKLRVCFDSFANATEKNPWIPHYTGEDWPERYANHFFDNNTGNCISYAVSFAYMARVLGYTEVYGCNSGGHGWAEIDGLIYDPEWVLHNDDLSYYGITYQETTGPSYARALSMGLPNVRIKL